MLLSKKTPGSHATTATCPQIKLLRRQGGAFSLIELLVVIAIVAILVTITIPATNSIRKSANLAECASNLRAISAALNLHLADNEGNFPVTATANSSERWTRNPTMTVYLPLERRAPTGGNWEHKAFVSPVAKNPAGESGPRKLRVTYAASAAMIGGATVQDLGTDRSLARSMTSIANPAQTILLYQGKIDTPSGGNGNNTNYSHLWGNISSDIGKSPQQTVRLDYPHDGKMNVMMADGSVQTITPDDFAKVTQERFRGLE